MKKSAKENLLQIKSLLPALTQDQYSEKQDVLSASSIGQHVRHILEFYLLLVSGSFSGTICYDNRKRDSRIEEDLEFAMHTIDQLFEGLNTLDEKQRVKLLADYSLEEDAQNKIDSSVGRELAYCIEHSIHHQALIKAGLFSLGLNHIIDKNFGLAYSTIRHRNNSCAQ